MTTSQLQNWSANQWLEWLNDIVDKEYQREMRCGYDEKIGTAAIGQLSSAIHRCMNGSELPSSHAICPLVRAMLDAYLACDLDGEYSSGRSSMGGVFGVLFGQLQDMYSARYAEWLWVKQYKSAAPTTMITATNQQLAMQTN